MTSQNPTFVLLLVGIGILAGLSQQPAVKKIVTPAKTATASSTPAPVLYPTVILSAPFSK